MPEATRRVTKSEAQEIVLGTWRRMPLTMPRNYELAKTVADKLVTELQFDTLGTQRDIMLSWIVRDMKL